MLPPRCIVRISQASEHAGRQDLVARPVVGVGRIDDLTHHVDATDEREAAYHLAPTRRSQRVLVVDAGVRGAQQQLAGADPGDGNLGELPVTEPGVRDDAQRPADLCGARHCTHPRKALWPVTAWPMIIWCTSDVPSYVSTDSRLFACRTVSYTHLRAHETGRNLVCR